MINKYYPPKEITVGSNNGLTKSRLMGLLKYDDNLDAFVWKVDRGKNKCRDKVAGTYNSDVDHRIRLDDRLYRFSELYELYFTEDMGNIFNEPCIDDIESIMDDIEDTLWETKWRR